MRSGFTTGSCATAAAGAACYMLLSGKTKDRMEITTPKGLVYQADIVDIDIQKDYVSCAVIKDGGDDPDITSGSYIYARVERQGEAGVSIDGGEGVGRVTLPGLDQPVGNAAINHVPRQMITDVVRDVCELLDYQGGIKVTISVPGGEELAKKTFNPKLGIEGGISIIGTSGVVEPMSNQAILDTIKVELRQKKAMGLKDIVMSPGNYGMDFMRDNYAYNLDKSVKCSNFIGNSIDMAVELGFGKLLLVGHIGKLIKVSGGIMNTHSKEADCRMELLAAAAIGAGADTNLTQEILAAVTTEEGIRLIKDKGLLDKTMEIVMDKAMFYLQKRAGDTMKVECLMFSNEQGLLGCSDGVNMMLKE